MLEIVFGQELLRIMCRQLFWKTSSFWLVVLVIFQDSAPHRSVLKTLLFNSLIAGFLGDDIYVLQSDKSPFLGRLNINPVFQVVFGIPY